MNGLQPVDVLRRSDRAQDPRLVDVIGQRQLDEDRVDLVVGVQRRDLREQILLARLRRQPDVVRVETGLERGLVLEPDVDL